MEHMCDYCGRQFAANRYLAKHKKESIECRKFKGVHFICMRCNGAFHTMRYFSLVEHLKSCSTESRIEEVMGELRSENTELKERVKTLESVIRDPPKEKHSPPTSSQRSKRGGEALDEIFGQPIDSREIFESLRSGYKSLANAQKSPSSTTLRKFKNLRRILFRTGDLDLYEDAIRESYNLLLKVCSSASLTTKRRTKIVRQHFTILDFRILGPSEAVWPAAVDGGLWKELELVLSCRPRTKVFDMDDLLSRICNVGLGVFPLREALVRELNDGPFLLAYMGGGAETDPYAYYYLKSVTRDRKYWQMDSGLWGLTTRLSEVLIPYLSSLFRMYYIGVFGDIQPRGDIFIENQLGVIENEMRQIIRTIILLCDEYQLRMLTRNVVSENSIVAGVNDVLNLRKRDPIGHTDTDSATLTKNALTSLFEGAIPGEDINDAVEGLMRA